MTSNKKPHPTIWAERYVGGLLPSERRVLSCLASYANPDGTHVFPTKQTIAKDTELSLSSVKRSLRKLKEDGWIRLGDQSLVKSRRKSNCRPIVYELNLEKRKQ